MTERLIAALAIFAGKTERFNVSLIDILARTAHTQFGLQREDILPTAEEVDAFLIENAGYVREPAEMSAPLPLGEPVPVYQGEERPAAELTETGGAQTSSLG